MQLGAVVFAPYPVAHVRQRCGRPFGDVVAGQVETRPPWATGRKGLGFPDARVTCGYLLVQLTSVVYGAGWRAGTERSAWPV